jgi:diguanylate cyclase (GGDEF)-like protein
MLADIAAIVSRTVRAVDICGRLGGDEFCVLLAGCSLDKARGLAEEIRGKIAGYRLAWGKDYYSVGVSIGVASRSAVADMRSLLRLADAATYAAKNAGRTRSSGRAYLRGRRQLRLGHPPAVDLPDRADG